MEYEPGPSVFLPGFVHSAFVAHGGEVREQVDNTISVIHITRSAQGNPTSPRMGTRYRPVSEEASNRVPERRLMA